MRNDKQYMVSENELLELDGSTDIIENRLIVKNFLKSKTPIEPSDAKQIVIEEIKHIAYHFSGVPITDETAEPYAESLLHKLSPLKQFNEVEIRAILKPLEKVLPQRIGYNGDPLIEQISPKVLINILVKELSSLTPKDNIKEYYDE